MLFSYVTSPAYLTLFLQVVAGFKPVENNKEGSYLTMWSLNGLVFGIINVSVTTKLANSDTKVTHVTSLFDKTWQGLCLYG
jgi:hypothetical protein